MKASRAGWALVALAVAMFVCVFLLTPLSGFETRPIPSIHPIGLFTLLLVFATAGLNAIALAVLGRRPRLSAELAALGIFLVLPGFVLDQTDQFSTFAPPEAIRILEYVLVLLEALLFVVAIWLYRDSRSRAPGETSSP